MHIPKSSTPMSNAFLLSNEDMDFRNVPTTTEAMVYEGNPLSQLCSLTNIENVTSLQFLELSNLPKFEVKKAITNLSNLTHLKITNCKLVKVLNLHLPNLEHLEVQNNALIHLDISKSPNIIFLDARENMISRINLCSNTKLQILKLGCNRIQNLDLSGQEDLKSLFVGGNLLSDIPRLPNPGSLLQLSIAHNSLKQREKVQNLGYFSNLQLFAFFGNTCSRCPFTRCFIASLVPTTIKEIYMESANVNEIDSFRKLFKKKSIVNARSMRLQQLKQNKQTEMNVNQILDQQKFSSIIEDKLKAKLTDEALYAVQALQYAADTMENQVISCKQQIQKLEQYRQENAQISSQLVQFKIDSQKSMKEFKEKEDTFNRERWELEKLKEDSDLMQETKMKNLVNKQQELQVSSLDIQAQLNIKDEEIKQLRQKLQQQQSQLEEVNSVKEQSEQELAKLIQCNNQLQQQGQIQNAEQIQQTYQMQLQQQVSQFQTQLNNVMLQMNLQQQQHQQIMDQEKIQMQAQLGQQYEQANETIDQVSQRNNQVLYQEVTMLKQQLQAENDALKEQNVSLQQFLQQNTQDYIQQLTDIGEAQEIEMNRERVKRLQDLEQLNKSFELMAKVVSELQKGSKKKDETVQSLMGVWGEVQAGWKQMW